jgi:hypothetical protein
MTLRTLSESEATGAEMAAAAVGPAATSVAALTVDSSKDSGTVIARPVVLSHSAALGDAAGLEGLTGQLRSFPFSSSLPGRHDPYLERRWASSRLISRIQVCCSNSRRLCTFFTTSMLPLRNIRGDVVGSGVSARGSPIMAFMQDAFTRLVTVPIITLIHLTAHRSDRLQSHHDFLSLHKDQRPQ